MKPFTIYKGKTVSINLDHIDTDQIIPKQYLKRIHRTGFGEFLFDEWRYLEDRSLNPKFSLNEPTRLAATILIAGENFGCGSSREHAPWALKDYGFSVIVAGSFADIFYMNCFNNEILPIKASREDREKLMALSGDVEITVDLVEQKIVCPDFTIHFDIESFWREKLLKGLDEISQTLQYEKEIVNYENLKKVYS